MQLVKLERGCIRKVARDPLDESKKTVVTIRDEFGHATVSVGLFIPTT